MTEHRICIAELDDNRSSSHNVLDDRAAQRPSCQHLAEWPILARRVAALRRRDEVGVGDTLSRIFRHFGSDYFQWFFKVVGINCGCDDRKEYLNRVYPY